MNTLPAVVLSRPDHLQAPFAGIKGRFYGGSHFPFVILLVLSLSCDWMRSVWLRKPKNPPARWAREVRTNAICGRSPYIRRRSPWLLPIAGQCRRPGGPASHPLLAQGIPKSPLTTSGGRSSAGSKPNMRAKKANSAWMARTTLGALRKP